MSEKKKLLRSQTNRMIAGICGGIAEMLGWDATVIRIAYVLLSIISAGFPGIAVYLILWLIIPITNHE
ncbi:MAG: PspC domain-containing protein [Paludibacteraceae bacterium]